MGQYKNVLSVQYGEYNKLYSLLNKLHPEFSKERKTDEVIKKMISDRGVELNGFESFLDIMTMNTNDNIRTLQYILEVFMLSFDIKKSLVRHYVKDEELFDFFKTTEVRQKEVESIIQYLDKNANFLMSWALLGKTQSYTIVYTKCLNGTKKGKHFITLLSDDMNWTYCIEELDWKNDKNFHIFFLAMNFIFYTEAFPECVVDGVPPSEKKNDNSKTITTSTKVISHTEKDVRGFIKPHFRSGYFRHYTSDHWVNCKGQVRFIAATMVKGKAKTVLTS